MTVLSPEQIANQVPVKQEEQNALAKAIDDLVSGRTKHKNETISYLATRCTMVKKDLDQAVQTLKDAENQIANMRRQAYELGGQFRGYVTDLQVLLQKEME